MRIRAAIAAPTAAEAHAHPARVAAARNAAHRVAGYRRARRRAGNLACAVGFCGRRHPCGRRGARNCICRRFSAAARRANGEDVPLIVLGMGKLGGRELNFSSDIDLVFLFSERGPDRWSARG